MTSEEALEYGIIDEIICKIASEVNKICGDNYIMMVTARSSAPLWKTQG